MEKLDSIQRKHFRASDLREYPVWVWNEDTDAYTPLRGHEIVPEEFGTYVIAATIRTVESLEFEGYLIGDGKSFYAFGLFVKGEEHVLNLNLPDLMRRTIKSICCLLGKPSLELFPVSYESPVSLPKGQTIKGALSGH